MSARRSTFTALAAALLFFSVAPLAAEAPRPVGAPALPRGSVAGPSQRESLARLLAGAATPVESLRVCVIRASFADTSFAAVSDSLYFANELRHLAEYYLAASGGRFHLVSALVPGVVALSHPESYYGADDLWKERMAEMLIELVAKTDDRVDFSQYDAFAVIHSGPGRETDSNGDSPTQVWSGFVNPDEMAEALEDTLALPGVPTNDPSPGGAFLITNLMVWPETASQDGMTYGSLGLYAYELALRIGMIPLYDGTPSSFPNSQGVGMFDLTSYGLYAAAGFIPALPSAFNRYLMGWVEPVTVEKDRVVRLVDINSASAGDTALVKIPIGPSEYYLVDNRVHDTNWNGVFDFLDVNGNGIPENEDTLRGAEFDYFLTESTDLRVEEGRLTGSGIMIWHVDEATIRAAIAAGGNPNDDASWKGVDLEEADHVQDLDSPGGSFAFGSYYDSFRSGNNDRFGPDTDPSSCSNSGARTGIEISGISEAAHAMRVSIHFAPPMSFKRGELAGDGVGRSPVPADLDGDGVEELVVAADSGLVYLVSAAGSAGWTGEAVQIAHIAGVAWAGSPIVADVSGDRTPEIFITSKDGSLYAFEPTGAPYTIDTDGTPGTIKLRGDRFSDPITLAIDDDAEPEVLVLSSTEDSTYATLIGDSRAVSVIPEVRKVGLGANEIRLRPGRIASDPALGSRVVGSLTDSGILFAVRLDGGALQFVFAAFSVQGAYSEYPLMDVSTALEVEGDDGVLSVPASGDVGKRGGDDVVLARADGRLLYFSSRSFDVHSVKLGGRNPSAPALADMDGDGTLETALRDNEYLYLFSGFGSPVSGWPIRIPESIAEHDPSRAFAPPVIGDINGDGRPEIVFRVGGDLRAYDSSGRELAGWPLPGEGFSDDSPVLLKGGGGALYIFDSSSFEPYSVDPRLGGSPGGAVVSLRRYDPDESYAGDGAWPCWRRDAGGSARQPEAAGASPREVRLDPATFIIYPNPAMGDRVTIRVLISAPAAVSVEILTIEGERVYSAARSHSWFAGSAVPFEEVVGTGGLKSGIYVCRLEVTGAGWSWSGAKKFGVTR